ncbi:MAG: transketolase [Candidatus Omnitrophica bacterium]|nr:transketolase [Candidatus Omnitrophota bacterium]
MSGLKKTAQAIRRDIVRMHAAANSSHIGSSLSSVDILTVLYFRILAVGPKKNCRPDRDRFILSKGHAATALYATLAERGILPRSCLSGYSTDGGRLPGHADNAGLACIEAATGSLGHGLALASGMAIAGKNDKYKSRYFVLLGDGECDEGSVWESALFAAHHKLDRITAIIDRNRLQGMGKTEEVIRLEPLLKKWTAFGWSGITVDGHDHAELEKVLSKIPLVKGKPTVIIANTVKGKGVSFMEDRLEWHYKSPTKDQLAQALKELA